MEVNFTQEEQAKMDFVDSLMAFNSISIGPKIKSDYTSYVRNYKLNIKTIKEAGKVMDKSLTYDFASFFERHNHSMIFNLSLNILNQRKNEVTDWLNNYNKKDAVGSLELNPDLKVPDYYENVEIHTQPGSYHGNPFAGILYHWMISPFLVHRDDDDGMGHALAGAVPKKKYSKVLDMGCGIGKSTFPYCDIFPEAEVHGIDYSEPMLKYAHQLAEKRNKEVKFSQRLAEDTGYQPETFDLVVALWLFHEIPTKIADQVISEAYRILKPGGVFALMEGPSYADLKENYSPLSAFMLDASGKRMSDPYLPGFFSRDRVEMIKLGGFEKAYDKNVHRQLAADSGGDKNLFGPYPWCVSIGEKV